MQTRRSDASLVLPLQHARTLGSQYKLSAKSHVQHYLLLIGDQTWGVQWISYFNRIYNLVILWSSLTYAACYVH